MLLELLAAAVITNSNPILKNIEPEIKIEQVEPTIEEPKKLTIEEKIAVNHYKCDEAVQYIRQDNAECLDKPIAPVVVNRTTPTQTRVKQAVRSSNGLIAGTYGSVRSGGNCVNEPGVNNPGSGNPITWAVTSNTPTIGATALWTYNHTGVVSGIYEGGQYVEVRHQNFSGSRTKFHISEFRGFR